MRLNLVMSAVHYQANMMISNRVGAITKFPVYRRLNSLRNLERI